jgi:hypothetical protein
VPNVYPASLAAPSAARARPAPKVRTPSPTECLNQKHVPDCDITAIPTALLAAITRLPVRASWRRPSRRRGLGSIALKPWALPCQARRRGARPGPRPRPGTHPTAPTSPTGRTRSVVVGVPLQRGFTPSRAAYALQAARTGTTRRGNQDPRHPKASHADGIIRSSDGLDLLRIGDHMPATFARRYRSPSASVRSLSERSHQRAPLVRFERTATAAEGDRLTLAGSRPSPRLPASPHVWLRRRNGRSRRPSAR